MSSPINSKHWWRPSNFGGQTGFQIIKDTNLEVFTTVHLLNSRLWCNFVEYAFLTGGNKSLQEDNELSIKLFC